MSWIHRINGPGAGHDPRRGNNALDCSLAGLSTWYGRPVVAAPRSEILGGEIGGRDRAEAWLGRRYALAGSYAAVDRILRSYGPGSAAALVTEWPGVGAHAWNALNDRGAVTWVDFQNGRIGPAPLYPAGRVYVICLDPDGRPVDVHRG